GDKIKRGQYIVGLQEQGFRSNGLSLVRKIMQKNYGEDWHLVSREGKHDLERTMAREVLTPSTIYCAAVVDMFGGLDREPRAEVTGVAHITGGGLPGKLARVLKPSGLGANIYDPFVPPSLMKYLQGIGKVSDEEAYRTWNMGQGMAIITPEPNGVIAVAQEHGIDAKVIGMVTDTSDKITINNKGAYGYSVGTTSLVF
ncbi:MAG: hypothetical protein IIA87_04890, partial [Nanoarchaeota archaeon]|nr:hypothetical protein [Nanoarchaeota archaeon]